MTLTAQQRADLTEEELAGLEDESLVDDDNDPGAAFAEDDTDEDEESLGVEADEKNEYDEDDADGDEGKEAGKGEGEEKDKGKEGKEPGRDDGAEPGADEDLRQPFVEPTPPKDVKPRLDALASDEATAEQKFEDGDFTAKEFAAEMRRINEARDSVKWEVRKHELAVESATKAFQDEWFKTVNEFAKEHPELRVSQLRWESFDAVVRRVTANQANAQLSNRAQLKKAHALWAEELGIDTKQAKPKEKDEKQARKPKPSSERRLPPTLDKVPAAGVSETDNGRFGQLNRLFNSGKPSDVMKAETMLGEMSAADQEAYLKAS